MQQTRRERDWAQVEAGGWRAHADQKAAQYEGIGTTWHMARARNLRRPLAELLPDCQQKWLCGDCGCTKTAQPLDCKRWKICPRCNRKRKGQYIHKFSKAMEKHQRVGWHWQLMTLSTRHTGELAADLDTLNGLRESMLRFCRSVRTKNHKKQGLEIVWFQVTEFTPGNDGKGHLHSHVAFFSPNFAYKKAWNYFDKNCREQFDSEQLNFARGPGGVAMTNRTDIAKYCAKHALACYVSDFGSDEIPDALFGHFLAATAERRLITSSEEFFKQDKVEPFCDCCGGRLEIFVSESAHAEGHKLANMWQFGIRWIAKTKASHGNQRQTG